MVAEPEVDLRVDLGLGHAGQLDFHRILDGGDVDVGLVDLVQRGVERRGLAATGGARDEDDAVGILDEAAERLEHGLRHHHLVQRQHRLARRAGEEAHDHLLPVGRRDGGDAEMRRAPADLLGEPSVLGEAGFGDVEVAEDLDPADQRQVELAGKREHLPQHPVDAEADPRLELLRFDVNVGRPLANGVEDDGVEHLDERGAFGQGGELLAGVVGPGEQVGALQRAEAQSRYPGRWNSGWRWRPRSRGPGRTRG